MANDTKTGQPTENLTEEVSRLREQVESLMRERVAPKVAHLAERAESAIGGATEVVRTQSDALANKVREQPLLSLVIAAGIGWLIGRAMR